VLQSVYISLTARRHFNAPTLERRYSVGPPFSSHFHTSSYANISILYANASSHASSLLHNACSRRRARPKILPQTTFIRIAKFQVDGVFTGWFRRPSFPHFHPSSAPYAFLSTNHLAHATTNVFCIVSPANFALVSHF